ncbi:MAG: GNAT family N-acetyltransferase [Gemmatimonadetes bacterium]|nr:GNAT family N-acetyltransferase [Gemmatimonadota bacterium]
MDEFTVRSIIPLAQPEVEVLLAESRREGFRFLDRLHADFESDANRFDAPGEALLGVYRGSALIAVGGLNRDPYVGDARTGRLRHLYVHPELRGKGIGRVLVDALMAEALSHFDVLRLRTDTAAAARFYEALGFVPESSPTATHLRVLRGAS